MHDSTAIQLRDPLRAEISQAVEAFLANSGTIEVIEQPIRREIDKVYHYNAEPVSGTKRSRVEYERRQQRMAGMIARHASIQIEGVEIRRTAAEVAKALRSEGERLTILSIEKIAARSGIELRDE